MRKFEFVGGKSRKFWMIDVLAKEVVSAYGPMDFYTYGKASKTTKRFPTSEKAQAFAVKQIASKVKEGYVEVIKEGESLKGKSCNLRRDKKAKSEFVIVTIDPQQANVTTKSGALGDDPKYAWRPFRSIAHAQSLFEEERQKALKAGFVETTGDADKIASAPAISTSSAKLLRKYVEQQLSVTHEFATWLRELVKKGPDELKLLGMRVLQNETKRGDRPTVQELETWAPLLPKLDKYESSGDHYELLLASLEAAKSKRVVDIVHGWFALSDPSSTFGLYSTLKHTKNAKRFAPLMEEGMLSKDELIGRSALEAWASLQKKPLVDACEVGLRNGTVGSGVKH